MTDTWTAAGRHTVQFYDNESFVYHAIADYFGAAEASEPLLLVSRPRTFDGVRGQLSSGRFGPAGAWQDRITFIDAEAALSQLMQGGTLDIVEAERLFRQLLSQVGPADRGVRLYGEPVDILCQHGRHEAALQLESLGGALLDANPRLSILCGYATARFQSKANERHLHAVCRRHTHVVPSETVIAAPCSPMSDRHSVHLQPAAGYYLLAAQQVLPPQASEADGCAPSVYVVEDDTGLRRSLGRMLGSYWRARTFDSAEAFLAELGAISSGCLVLDIQLPGMSGLQLMERLRDAGISWPIIAMSGLQDDHTPSEALRLGAGAFLRKPFDSDALLDLVAESFSQTTAAIAGV